MDNINRDFRGYVFSVLYDMSNHPETDYVFSFEPNYNQVKGNEINLKTAGLWVLSEIMYDFEETVKSGNYYDKLRIIQGDIENAKKETRLGTKYFDNEKFSDLVKNIPILVMVKIVKDYDYEWLPVILIISLIVGSVIYFGLWFIYKKITLYIVFGKKDK